MTSEWSESYDRMSAAELQAELRRLRENLHDLEETHAFTFGKTTVHISAGQAQSMQEEHEEECREHRARIRLMETFLEQKGA